MLNSYITGSTSITIPASVLKTLSGLSGFSVTATGTATASKDSAGDLIAQLPVTGGRQGVYYDVIDHEGSGVTLSDSKGSYAISDFRIDGLNNRVYGNVTETINGKTITYLDATLFTIGSNGSLEVTTGLASTLNSTLGTSLKAGAVFGSAAPEPVANPISAASEEAASFVSLFNDTGFQGLTQPIVDGTTNITLSLATFTGLGVTITEDSHATITSGVASFLENGGTETATGDTILDQNNGLTFTHGAKKVDIANLLFDTIHHVVDADIYVNGVFQGNAADFSLATNGTMTFKAGAAAAVDSALGITGVTSSTVLGTASLNPFALTHLEAAQIAAVSNAMGSHTGPGA